MDIFYSDAMVSDYLKDSHLSISLLVVLVFLPTISRRLLLTEEHCSCNDIINMEVWLMVWIGYMVGPSLYCNALLAPIKSIMKFP